MNTSTIKSSENTSITSLASYVLGGAVTAVSGLFGILTLGVANEKFNMLKILKSDHREALSLMSGKDLLNAVAFYFDEIKRGFFPRYDIWPEMYDELAGSRYSILETITADNPEGSAADHILKFAAGEFTGDAFIAGSSFFISAMALAYIWNTYDQNKAIDNQALIHQSPEVKLIDVACENLDSNKVSDISNTTMSEFRKLS